MKSYEIGIEDPERDDRTDQERWGGWARWVLKQHHGIDLDKPLPEVAEDARDGT